MPFYEDLENIASNATAQIMSNQNICKLLYYYPKNTDLRYDPYAQPDIEKPNELLFKHILAISFFASKNDFVSTLKYLFE